MSDKSVIQESIIEQLRKENTELKQQNKELIEFLESTRDDLFNAEQVRVGDVDRFLNKYK